MAERETGAVLEILESFQGMEPLKQLFWHELSYDRVNQSLGRRNWSGTASRALADDPLLFASGGDQGAFHVIYCRLAGRLLLGLERPVVTRLLREHPHSLFVFSDSDRQRWHFLNVKQADDSARRTQFRRMTIGEGERLRTTAQRLDLLRLADPRAAPLAIQEQHDEAFDVEAVQKQFFREFASLHGEFADEIACVRGLESRARALAHQLLDRMLFLYFIQKKGWLAEDPKYLYSRFIEHHRREPLGTSYYSAVLYSLFECLADPRRIFNSAVGVVPFLNGGLFEESATQDQRVAEARIRIKNATFKSLFENLLEHFNFTVTEDTPLDVEVAIDPEMLGKIFESLVLQEEKEPGKDLRKMTGSYYTPRPIVHFMCQEALKEHLVTRCADMASAPPAQAAAAGGASFRERLSDLIALPPADQLDDEQAAHLAQLFTPDEARALRQAILDCRVCDPAVGSGAFPVGMLHEMVGALARLDRIIDGPQVLERPNYEYGQKRRIIESCLYGVDIQEQAVRLCELRLWLSLVVDYQLEPGPFATAIKKVPALPNLSYHVVRGDSLLERLFGHLVQLDELSRDSATHEVIAAITEDKRRYFSEARSDEKRRLELRILAQQADLAERLVAEKQRRRQKVNLNLFGESVKDRKLRETREVQDAALADLEKKIHKAREALEKLTKQKHTAGAGDVETLRRAHFQAGDAPTFIWRVDFAEVFAAKGGFDIIIGNPPYAGFHGMSKQYKDLLKGQYACAAGRFDFYMPFIERGLRTLAENQFLTFICPSTFLKRDGGASLRILLRQTFGLKRLVDFGDQQIFEDATNYTGVFTFSRTCTDPIQVCDGRVEGPSVSLAVRTFAVDDLPDDGSLWFLPTGTVHSLWRRLKAREFVPLGELCIISEGIVTGCNDVFLLSRTEARRLGFEHDVAVPCLRGSEVHPFVADLAADVVIYPYDRTTGKVIPEPRLKRDAPKLYSYLRSRRSDLQGRDYFDQSSKQWFELWNERSVDNLFRRKLVVSELGDRNSFAFGEEGVVYGDTVCGIVPRAGSEIDLEALLGILNSQLLTDYMKQLSVPKANGFFIYKPVFLKELPIPTLSASDKTRLSALVRDLARRPIQAGELIAAIDRVVLDIYQPLGAGCAGRSSRS